MRIRLFSLFSLFSRYCRCCTGRLACTALRPAVSAAISPAAGDVEVPSGGDHSRMIKQSQVSSVRHGRPAGPVGPVKTAAAVLIAGATVVLAACSSGTGSSAGGTAAPGTTSAARSSSTHSGSPMASSASPKSSSVSPAASAGSPKGGSGSPMANKSTCKHVDSLRTSLQDLNHLQLNPSSASKLRTDLTNIEKQLAALKSQGGNSALSGQVKQLSTSVAKVKKAANALSTPPTRAQATAVVTSLTELKAQSRQRSRL